MNPGYSGYSPQPPSSKEQLSETFIMFSPKKGAFSFLLQEYTITATMQHEDEVIVTLVFEDDFSTAILKLPFEQFIAKRVEKKAAE
jgi:hypothetical protein